MAYKNPFAGISQIDVPKLTGEDFQGMSNLLGKAATSVGDYLKKEEDKRVGQFNAALEGAQYSGDTDAMKQLMGYQGFSNPENMYKAQTAIRGAIEDTALNKFNLSLERAKQTGDLGGLDLATNDLTGNLDYLSPAKEQQAQLALMRARPAIESASAERGVLSDFLGQIGQSRAGFTEYFTKALGDNNPYIALDNGIPTPIPKTIKDFESSAIAEVADTNPTLSKDSTEFGALVANTATKQHQQYQVEQDAEMNKLLGRAPENIQAPSQILQKTLTRVLREFDVKGKDSSGIRGKIASVYDMSTKIDPKVKADQLDPALASIDAETALLQAENDEKYKVLTQFAQEDLKKLQSLSSGNQKTIEAALDTVRGSTKWLSYDTVRRDRIRDELVENYYDKPVEGFNRKAYPQEIADAILMARRDPWYSDATGVDLAKFKDSLITQMRNTDEIAKRAGATPEDLTKRVSDYFTTKAGISARAGARKLAAEAKVYSALGLIPSSLFSKRDTAQLTRALMSAAKQDTVSDPSVTGTSSTGGLTSPPPSIAGISGDGVQPRAPNQPAVSNAPDNIKPTAASRIFMDKVKAAQGAKKDSRPSTSKYTESSLSVNEANKQAIDSLKALLPRTTNPADKARLERQIQLLQSDGKPVKKSTQLTAKDVVTRLGPLGLPKVVVEDFAAQVPEESSGRQFINGKITTSHKGARGLAQLFPDAVTDVYRSLNQGKDPTPQQIEEIINDEQLNLEYGARYYNLLFKKYGERFLAAAAYNDGPGDVDKLLAKSKAKDIAIIFDKLPEETRNYLTRLGYKKGK